MPGDFIPAGPYVPEGGGGGGGGTTALVADAINDGTTTVAPSQNAVFDALALKADAHEVRHDFVSPNDYMGLAAAGSANSASVWAITRLAITSAGTTTVTHATNVKWDDRLTATYT